VDIPLVVIAQMQQLSGLLVHAGEGIKVFLLQRKDLPSQHQQFPPTKRGGRHTSKLSFIRFGFTVFGTVVQFPRWIHQLINTLPSGLPYFSARRFVRGSVRTAESFEPRGWPSAVYTKDDLDSVDEVKEGTYGSRR
jgi:hypothetical protein